MKGKKKREYTVLFCVWTVRGVKLLVVGYLDMNDICDVKFEGFCAKTTNIL